MADGLAIGMAGEAGKKVNKPGGCGAGRLTKKSLRRGGISSIRSAAGIHSGVSDPMSKSNRLRQLALRGCLIAGVLLCSIHEIKAQSNSGDQAAHAQEAAAETNSIARELLSAIYSVLDKWDSVIAANESAAESERAKEKREKNDLKAQQRMAEAAYIMVGLGVLQLCLSLGGIVLLARTLTANAKSAEAAASAADATKQAADAARESLEISRLAERPFLTAINVRPRGFDDDLAAENEVKGIRILEILFDIVNVGKGPGFIKKVEIACEFAHVPHKVTKTPEGPTDWPGLEVVSADINRPMSWENEPFHVMEFTADEKAAALRYFKPLYVFGSILYFDIFKITRRSGFMFEYEPKSKTFLVSGPNSFWYDREEPPETNANYPPHGSNP